MNIQNFSIQLHSSLRWFSAFAFCAVVASTSTCFSADAKQKKITYDEHIRPIFKQYCFACHDSDGKDGDLALDSFAAIMEGGGSGEAVINGDANASRLFKVVTHQESPKMPPESDKMPQKTLDLLQQWIDGGLPENSGSVVQVKKKTNLAFVASSADGKPVGPAAMPQNVFRQPMVYTKKAAAIPSLACSPWAPLIAIPGQHQVSLYNTDTSKLVGVLPFPEGSPHVLKFSRDGSLLLVAGGTYSATGVATLYDVKTGNRIVKVGDEIDAVMAADLHPMLASVALGGPRRVVRVFSLEDESLLFEIKKHTDWVTAIGFSPDGKMLLTADRSGGVFLWEADTGREIAELRGHKGTVHTIAWRADSKVIATGGQDGTLRLWKSEDGKQFKSSGAHSKGVSAIHFGADGRIVTTGRDNKVRLWKPDGNLSRGLATLKDIGLAVCWTHDGKRIAVGDFTGEVRLINAENAKQISLLPANPPTLAMRLGTSQKHLDTSSTVVLQFAAAKAKAEQEFGTANGEMKRLENLLKGATTSMQNAQKKQTQADTVLKQSLNAIHENDKQDHAALLELNKAASEISSAAIKVAEIKQQQLASKKPAEAQALANQAKKSEALLATTRTRLEAVENKRKDLSKKRLTLVSNSNTSKKQLNSEIAATNNAIQAKNNAFQTLENFKKQLNQMKQVLTSAEQELTTKEQLRNEAKAGFESLRTELIAYETAQDRLKALIGKAGENQQLADKELNSKKTARDQTAGNEMAKQKAVDSAAAKLAAAKQEFEKAQKALTAAKDELGKKVVTASQAQQNFEKAEVEAAQAKKNLEFFNQAKALQKELAK